MCVLLFSDCMSRFGWCYFRLAHGFDITIACLFAFVLVIVVYFILFHFISIRQVYKYICDFIFRNHILSHSLSHHFKLSFSRHVISLTQFRMCFSPVLDCFLFSFHFLFICFVCARFDSSILICALGCLLECAYTVTIPFLSKWQCHSTRLVYSICTYVTIFLINLLKCMRINNTKYSLNGDVIVRSVHYKCALFAILFIYIDECCQTSN